MQIKLKELINIFDESSKGIFYNLHEVIEDTPEWLENYEDLDIIYFAEHSGDKYASNYLKVMLIKKTMVDIARTIYVRFGDKWKKTYDAMTKEYNPINNYDMVEEESVNSKIVLNVGTNARTYGFGSTTGSPTDEANSTSTTEGKADDNKRKLTRSGNIGVTTSAQLLEGELAVRKNIFIDSVMKDIDSMLCLQIY